MDTSTTNTVALDESVVDAVRHRVGCHDGLDITPAQVRSVLKHWRIEIANQVTPTNTATRECETMKFRKKPVVVEARQFDGTVASANEIREWAKMPDGMSAEVGRSFRGDHCYDLRIKTLEGNMRADAGDWIIRGVKGEFYPCKPDIFAATYDPAATLTQQQGGEQEAGGGWTPQLMDELLACMDGWGLIIGERSVRHGDTWAWEMKDAAALIRTLRSKQPAGG